MGKRDITIACKGKWQQKEEEERRGREKKKVSDNTHMRNLQQEGTEEMQETKKAHAQETLLTEWFTEVVR